MGILGDEVCVFDAEQGKPVFFGDAANISELLPAARGWHELVGECIKRASEEKNDPPRFAPLIGLYEAGINLSLIAYAARRALHGTTDADTELHERGLVVAAQKLQAELCDSLWVGLSFVDVATQEAVDIHKASIGDVFLYAKDELELAGCCVEMIEQAASDGEEYDPELTSMLERHHANQAFLIAEIKRRMEEKREV